MAKVFLSWEEKRINQEMFLAYNLKMTMFLYVFPILCSKRICKFSIQRLTFKIFGCQSSLEILRVYWSKQDRFTALVVSFRFSVAFSLFDSSGPSSLRCQCSFLNFIQNVVGKGMSGYFFWAFCLNKKISVFLKYLFKPKE